MKQFNNVLLISPINDQLVEQAAELLTTSQAMVTLMSIAPNLEVRKVSTASGKEIDLQVLLEEELQSELAEIAQPLLDEHKRVQTVVKTDDHAFIKVIEQVVSGKHDLVMMLADGVSSIREQLFGTLSMHLMRKCPCAVWVVKPSKRQKLRNVFAAVDPDADNPIRNELNIEVLKRASTVAQNNNAKLHIVHAWNTFGAEGTRGRRLMTKTEVRMYVEEIKNAHRKHLDLLVQDQADESAIVHMLQGRAGTVIPKAIENNKGDLLVMGTVCRTGIPGFFIGNTAETILNQVDCSVLTVKPKSFVSPIA
ncbi:MAG: universal stress protein [Mariniblastus sp.]